MFTSQLPLGAQKILGALYNAGFECSVVGGAVRDYVMGREPRDYDICTAATPEQMIEILTPLTKEIIPTGIKHGTITAVMEDGSMYEVTTYRVDGKYSDGRHPDDVTFTASLEEDLARRDFTINAMAMRWPSMEIVDPFGGQKDLSYRGELSAGLLRCVGNPSERFKEDPLRILRGVRFLAQLNLAGTNEKTWRAISDLAPLLRNVSKERIGAELTKILTSNYPVELMEFYEVCAEILPEMKSMVGFRQNNPYHCHLVWEHTYWALRALPNEAPQHPDFDKLTVALALLLHDTGKPESYTTEVKENGETRGHFYGHEERSEEIARTALTRLRFPTKVINDVCELILAHNATILPKEKLIRRLMNKHGIVQTRHLLYHNLCDTIGRGSGTLRWDECVKEARDAIELFKDMLTRPHTFSVKDLAINGHDVMALGIPEGAWVGMILKDCLNAVMNDTVPNDRDALLKLVESYLSVYDDPNF